MPSVDAAAPHADAHPEDPQVRDAAQGLLQQAA